MKQFISPEILKEYGPELIPLEPLDDEGKTVYLLLVKRKDLIRRKYALTSSTRPSTQTRGTTRPTQGNRARKERRDRIRAIQKP